MDLSILLTFEVVGLIGLASVMTFVLIRDDVTRWRSPEATATLPLTVFCPRSMGPAGVRLRAEVRADRTELSVLECDEFEGGSVLCDRECLEPAVVM